MTAAASSRAAASGGLASPIAVCDTEDIETNPPVGPEGTGPDHVLDGHDILGVPSGGDARDDLTDVPMPELSMVDDVAQRLDGLLVPDEPHDDESTWEQSSLVPDHLGGGLDSTPWEDGMSADGSDAGTLDPGGFELLEGPIVDHNLDGIDDAAQGHGHG